MAMAVTQIATATAALSWMFAEWIAKGKPSVLGICFRRRRWPGSHHPRIRLRRPNGLAGCLADGRAGMAMAVTQIATGAAALAWMFAEWISKGKPSVLGIASGAVAGLVAITPASGFVGPIGALVIGIAAGVICFWSATSLKKMLGYDDSLDAFGVHAIGGIVGALLTGFFAVESIGGTAGSFGQFIIQAKGVGITIVYDAVVTFIILKVLDMVIGLRVSEEEEREGLGYLRCMESVWSKGAVRPTTRSDRGQVALGRPSCPVC